MKEKEEHEESETKIEQGSDTNQLDSEMNEKLRIAAYFDDIDEARLLISNNADVNSTYHSETPLHKAASQHSYRVAKLLIENGADVNAVDDTNHTPLHNAASSRSLAILKLLLENGANVSANDDGNNTPLHRVAFEPHHSEELNVDSAELIINELITHGADINAKTIVGRTPFHHAASMGSIDVIDTLMQAGADVNTIDNHNRKPENDFFIYSQLYPLLEDGILKVVKKEVITHIQTLLRKRRSLIQTDDYGIVDRKKWDDELEYFITNVLAPKMDPSHIYIRWILNYNGGSEALHDMEAIKKVVEDLIEDESYLYERDSYSDDIDPIDYENMCADILKENGWDTRITSASGDQGVDVFAEKDGYSIVLQCKKHSSPVGNKAVQEAHAGKGFMGATIAAVVTNTSYTQSAKQLAASLDVLLLHHDELCNISDKL